MRPVPVRVFVALLSSFCRRLHLFFLFIAFIWSRAYIAIASPSPHIHSISPLYVPYRHMLLPTLFGCGTNEWGKPETRTSFILYYLALKMPLRRDSISFRQLFDEYHSQ